MMYQDSKGRILHPDEIDELATHEIELMQIHVYDDFYQD